MDTDPDVLVSRPRRRQVKETGPWGACAGASTWLGLSVHCWGKKGSSLGGVQASGC